MFQKYQHFDIFYNNAMFKTLKYPNLLAPELCF